MTLDDSRRALQREALRLHERYQREVIERFSVCPWARPARVAGKMRSHVAVERGLEPAALAPIVDRWAEDHDVEVAFVIVPWFEGGRATFEAWAAELGALREDVFWGAAFHPDPGATAGVIQLLRQSPDPTVQLVRRHRIEEVRAQDPPHYKDIFDVSLRELHGRESMRTVAASVLAHNTRLVDRNRRVLSGIVADIRRDRNETYRHILRLSA